MWWLTLIKNSLPRGSSREKQTDMSYTERKNIERHIKTHSERSAEDHAAVDVLRTLCGFYSQSTRFGI